MIRVQKRTTEEKEKQAITKKIKVIRSTIQKLRKTLKSVKKTTRVLEGKSITKIKIMTKEQEEVVRSLNETIIEVSKTIQKEKLEILKITKKVKNSETEKHRARKL